MYGKYTIEIRNRLQDFDNNRSRITRKLEEILSEYKEFSEYIKYWE